jgi:D-alanyl-D-alanine carboxypeptidase
MDYLIRGIYQACYQKRIFSFLGRMAQYARLKQLIGCTLLILLLLSCDTTGPALPPDVGKAGDGNLDVSLEYLRDKHNLPALGAMLIHGDEIVEMEAVGLRAIGFTEEVTVEDRWHLGSITKAMTATLAARLVENGEVSWDTTIAGVFPDLVGSIRSEYEDVRLDELLSHTAGLIGDISKAPSWSTLWTDTDPLPVQRRKLTAELLSLEPEASRGTYLYSNAGYVVAGSMLEEITGESWEELMDREVFTPLGMESTGFGAPGSAGTRDEPWGHQQIYYHFNVILDPVEPGPYADNPPAIGPAGTIHSTFDDYAAYLMAHLAGARGEGGFLSAETFLKLHTPVPGNDYALGWAILEKDWAEGRILYHDGSNSMWYAIVVLAPNRNLALLAVSNAFGDAIYATDEALGVLVERYDAAN